MNNNGLICFCATTDTFRPSEPVVHKMENKSVKSTPITFTLSKGHCPPVNINQVETLQVDVVKDLGLHLDCKLNWKDYIHKKKTNRLKSQRLQLASWQKMTNVTKKQNRCLQSNMNLGH